MSFIQFGSVGAIHTPRIVPVPFSPTLAVNGITVDFMEEGPPGCIVSSMSREFGEAHTGASWWADVKTVMSSWAETSDVARKSASNVVQSLPRRPVKLAMTAHKRAN